MWKQLNSLDGRFKEYYYINQNGEVMSEKGKRKILTPTNRVFRLVKVDGTSTTTTMERLKKIYNGTNVVEDLEGEEWEWIKGYEGKYLISTKGRIKSFTSQKNGELLVQIPNQKGYLEVKLIKGGKPIKYKVHRLVGETFIPNPKGLETINHKDLNKRNNTLENLEWLSHSDNIKHYLKNKRKEGKNNGN